MRLKGKVGEKMVHVIKIKKKPVEEPEVEAVAEEAPDPEPAIAPELDAEGNVIKKAKKGSVSGPTISLGDGITLRADAYSWVVDVRGRYSYFATLPQAFNHLFNYKVRSSNVRSLEGLASAVKEAQAWIHDMLSPLDTWEKSGVHLGSDPTEGVRSVASSVPDSAHGGRSRKGKSKED